jgi:hypothetical protein
MPLTLLYSHSFMLRYVTSACDAARAALCAACVGRGAGDGDGNLLLGWTGGAGRGGGQINLSTRPASSIGGDDIWKLATDALVTPAPSWSCCHALVTPWSRPGHALHRESPQAADARATRRHTNTRTHGHTGTDADADGDAWVTPWSAQGATTCGMWWQ